MIPTLFPQLSSLPPSLPSSLLLSPLGVMSQVTEWSCNLELAPCGRSSKFSLCQIFTITVARCCDISQCLLQRLAERTSYFHYFIYFFIKVGQGIQAQERSRENRDTDEEERRCSIVLAVWVPANDQFLKTFCLWVNVQPIRCEDFLLTAFPLLPRHLIVFHERICCYRKFYK